MKTYVQNLLLLPALIAGLALIPAVRATAQTSTTLHGTFANVISSVTDTVAALQVGAYYYPWYGPFPGGHTWTDTLREHLVPQQPPALGYYSSRNSATIEGQIDQSHRGNISFWVVSWWGPGSAEDNTFRFNILLNPRAGELRYAIHYESTGRLGSFDNPNFANLVPDFLYLARIYFSRTNYLRINGRPVVFLYVTRAYFSTQTARDAVANLRQTLMSQYGVNPYLVGDDVFPGQNDPQRAALWDAITDFDVYGSALQAYGSTTTAVSVLASQFQSARQMAQSVQVGFIPTVSPGFNDRAVRTGHPAAPRYLTDVSGAAEGSLFCAELKQAALPNLDPTTGILMVSTFNEWHEDTQIEPTVIGTATTLDDSGAGIYAQGYEYSGYGDLYLDELRAATTAPSITCPPDQVVAATSGAGAVVDYPAPYIMDDCQEVTVTCSPASGTIFPIGSTTVTCIATDSLGEQSSCTFSVHVQGAAEQIHGLIALVRSLGLQPGIANSLIVKLQGAVSDLDHRNLKATCGHLGAFLNEAKAQLGKKLTLTQAQLLMAEATRIRTVLGCR